MAAQSGTKLGHRSSSGNRRRSGQRASAVMRCSWCMQRRGNKKYENLFLHEYIKVDAGKLAYIFAPMKNIPKKDASAKIFEGNGRE